MNDISKEVMEKLNSLEHRISKLEQDNVDVGRGLTANTDKKLSIKEFLLTKNVQDDVKKTLAIGFYLERHDGMSSFNVKDIEAGFERAKEKKPSNLNDKVNMNIRNGFMDEAKEKKENRKAWYLTNTGEDVVANKLNRNKEN